MRRLGVPLLALFGAVASLGAPQPLAAQQRPGPRLLVQARQLINDVNFDSAAAVFRRVLDPRSRATNDEKVRALVFLGFLALDNGDAQDARQRFRDALGLNPGERVDTLGWLHQALVATFEEVRSGMAGARQTRARDSLLAGIQAFGALRYADAKRLLPFGLVATLAQKEDAQWGVGLQLLVEALVQEHSDSLATFWLRWGLRENLELRFDTLNTLPAALSALERVRPSARRRPTDVFAVTNYEWGAPSGGRRQTAPQGALRLVRGEDSVAASIEARILQPGTTVSLAPGTHAIRVRLRDTTFLVQREVLPQVTTVLEFRYVAAPARLLFRAQPRRGQAGALLDTVAVSAVDDGGNLVPQPPMRIGISLDSNAAGAVLSGTTSAGTLAGVATFTDLRVSRAGRFTLSVVAAGLPRVWSEPFDVAPVASRLAFRTQPANVQAGSLIPSFQVTLQDSAGSVVATATGAVRVTVGAGPNGATLRGRTDVAAVNGVATFDSVRVDRLGRYALTAQASGLQSATSGIFEVLAPPARLVFRLPMPSGQVGQLLPPIQVLVQDSAGNTASLATNSVRLEISPNASALSGATLRAAVAGVATFDSLRVSQVGRYTVTASSQGLASATGGPVEVTLASPAAPSRPPATPPVTALTPPPATTPTPAPATPTLAPGAIAVRSELLSSGGSHTCGASSFGIVCWGDNSSGQLGDGSRTPRSLPTSVTLGRFRSISAGEGHTCALKADGTITCWGRNSAGQLGDGTNTPRTTPGSVAGARLYIALSAGANHTCALAADSSAYCWGANNEGQLGTGSKSYQGAPVAVQGNRKLVAISAGANHTCALTATGALYCWGANREGQLGDGSTSGKLVPVSVAGTYVAVSAGTDHTCAVSAAGGALCWGADDEGQLGDSATARRTRPAAVRGGRTWTAISAGDRFTCAVTAADDAYCWGRNNEGQLGVRLASGAASRVPVAISGPKFAAVTAGVQHACGILTDGRAFCWGSDASGRLGNGSSSSGNLAPVPVSGGNVFR